MSRGCGRLGFRQETWDVSKRVAFEMTMQKNSKAERKAETKRKCQSSAARSIAGTKLLSISVVPSWDVGQGTSDSPIPRNLPSSVE
jgi:hypothetical protein